MGLRPKDRGSGQVLWFPPDSELVLRRGTATEALTAIPIDLADEWTLPSWEALELADVPYDDRGPFAPDDENAMPDRIERLALRVQALPESSVRHRLGGWPEHIQGEMRVECELASHGQDLGDVDFTGDRGKAAESRALEWELLLQVDSDDDLGTMFGDGGRIYFWIRRADLAQARFDDTWLVLQCF
jgi:hypothetical protein